MKDNFAVEIIEPPIYEELNWDMKKIMKALEYIRQKLPSHLTDLSNELEYVLLAFEDKLGSPYPVIGIGSSNQKIVAQLPDFNTLYNRVEILIRDELTLEIIKSELDNVDSVSWEDLQEMKFYPKE